MNTDDMGLDEGLPEEAPAPSGGRHAAADAEPDDASYEQIDEADDSADTDLDDDVADWENDALGVQAFVDDDPYKSWLEMQVVDPEGRIGQVSWGLGPLQVADLLQQLFDVQEEQHLAQWVASGRDPNQFEFSSPRVGESDEIEQPEEIEDDGPDSEESKSEKALRWVKRSGDPLSMNEFADRAPNVLGLPFKYVLTAAAVIFALGSLILGLAL